MLFLPYVLMPFLTKERILTWALLFVVHAMLMLDFTGGSSYGIKILCGYNEVILVFVIRAVAKMSSGIISGIGHVSFWLSMLTACYVTESESYLHICLSMSVYAFVYSVILCAYHHSHRSKERRDS